jgi:hypothetical protein
MIMFSYKLGNVETETGTHTWIIPYKEKGSDQRDVPIYHRVQ